VNVKYIIDLMNRPVAFAIFAHPDDEAFGPSGTIAILSQTHDIYLLCATRGEAGENHSGTSKSLHDVRAEEVKKSANILGVKGVFFLGFQDGALCNNLYHEIAQKIQVQVDKLHPSMILTNEPHGVSGHLDHVAVSMISSYVFQHNKDIKEIWYNCLTKDQTDLRPPYFIYFPPGYPRERVDKVVDVSSVWGLKMQAIKQHKSQKKDMQNVVLALNFFVLKNLGKKEEYFLVSKK
jgi:LmbE family N-acetylglucosaminyl deacetylase